MATLKGYWKQSDWEGAHARGYQQEVFSVTHEPKLCEKLTRKVSALQPDATRILIPGCGSAGALEKRLAEREKDDWIYCTDFQGVIAHAPKSTSKKIHYAAHDMLEPFQQNFDIVMPVNAVVSGYEQENKTMLRNLYGALVPGGYMVGLFPTFFSMIDIQLNTKNEDLKGLLRNSSDIEDLAVIDPAGDARQIFYTPGALLERLSDVGFDENEIEMEVFWCNTPYFKAEAKRLYNIQDDDVPIYEYLVTARKPPRP